MAGRQPLPYLFPMKHVKSIHELYILAHHNKMYRAMIFDAATNLGGDSTIKTIEQAKAWLEVNANETVSMEGGGEEGVVAEINSLIDLEMKQDFRIPQSTPHDTGMQTAS